MFITTDKDKGVLRGMRIDPKFMDLVREMPGRKRWRGREVAFEMSASNIDYIRSVWPHAVWEAAAEERLREVDALREHENGMRAAKRSELTLDGAFRFKTKPFAHQAKVFMLSRDQPVYALLMEMGTGKTKVILDNAAYLWQQGAIDTLVAIAPNGVHRAWVTNHVPAHMPDWTNYKAAFYSANARKYDRVRFEETLDWTKGLRVIAINVEMFSTAQGYDRFLNWFTDNRGKANCKMLMTVDESTRIKSPSSNRSRTIRKLGTLADYRRIMTGSPVTKGIEDLYAQFMYLSPDILGFTTFAQFTARYCIMGGFERREIVGYRNVDELRKRIDAYSFRVTKDECLDLPPKVYIERPVELTSEQRRIYMSLRDECMVQFKNVTVVTPQVIVALLRLQQVLCGFLPVPDDEDGTRQPPMEIPSNRLDACMEELAEAQGKTIIWARFKHDIDAIMARCKKEGYRAVAYHGDVSATDRAAAVRAFMEDPNINPFVGTPASGGLGLDLWIARNVFYYSNDFNAETRWQSEDRAHRIGQRYSVNIVDFYAANTVDRKILKRLKGKRNVADMVLDENFFEDNDEDAGGSKPTLTTEEVVS